jgi:serine/threonine-protein kinase
METDPLIGSILAGRFRLEEQISRGGMGVVYRAVQMGLERTVAIKLIQSVICGVTGTRERFRREARAVARLNHAGVAQVHDFGATDDGGLFLVMEYVPGGPLSRFKSDPPPLPVVLELADQILSALAYTHARGLVHRDLKPENILLSGPLGGADLQAKIVDFGIATIVGMDGELTADGMAVGSPYYMSPEQASARSVGPSADLYSVGTILYQILSGTLPFVSSNPIEVMTRKVNEDPPRLVARPPFVLDDGLVDVIMKAIARDPEQRHALAADFRVALLPYWSSEGASAEGPPSLTEALHPSGGGAPLLDPSDGPMVGRDREARLLVDTAESVAATGRGHMILIDAASGVGKSRLTTWLRQRMEETGRMRTVMAVFRGIGRIGDGIPRALEGLLGSESLGRPQLRERVATFLQTLGLGEMEDVELVVEFLRPQSEDSGDALGLRSKNLRLQERLFRALARQRPLLLVLEDLHKATGQDIELLEHLLVGLRVSPAPILVVATMRAGAAMRRRHLGLERLAVFEGSEVTRLRLHPLTLDAVQEIVRTSVPEAEAHAHAILERSGGNPLYVVQFVTWLRTRQGTWDDAQLPASLHEILGARIADAVGHDAQGERLRRLLLHCAILGEPIQLRQLQRLYAHEGLPADDQAALLDDLDLLVERGLLGDVAGSDGELLRFDHGLFKDHILAAAGERQARRVHAALAVMLADGESADGSGSVDAGDVAQHAMAAGDRRVAAQYLREAGMGQLVSGAFERAAELFEQWLALCVDQGDELGQASARQMLAVALLQLKDYGEAEAVLEQLRRSDDPAHQVQALVGLARIRAARHNFPEGRKLVAQVHRVLQDFPSAPPASHQQVRVVHADLMIRQGRFDGVAETLRPILAQPADVELQLEALELMGVGLLRLGEFPAARTAFGHAVNLAARRADRRTGFRLACRLAEVERLAGRAEGSSSELDGQREWALASGRSELLAEIDLADGERALELGQLDQAVEHLNRACERFGDLGAARRSAAIYGLALAQLGSGDLRASYGSVQRLMRSAEGLGWLSGPVTLLASLLALLEGDVGGALRRLSHERVRRTAIVDPRVARTLQSVGEHLAGRGRIFEAREALARAHALWTNLGRQLAADRCAALRDSLEG